MKIRADFVTNSSSSSFTVMGLDFPAFDKFLEENPITFTPSLADYESYEEYQKYCEELGEAPKKTYKNVTELLHAIAKAEDGEPLNDDDIDMLHMEVPSSSDAEEYYLEGLTNELSNEWDKYWFENYEYGEDVPEEVMDAFDEAFYESHMPVQADDFIRRLSYECISDELEYVSDKRSLQLAPLKDFMIDKRDEFINESRYLFLNGVACPGGMTGWIDIAAYKVDHGKIFYLNQTYYSPSQYDYNPYCLTREERFEAICSNLEELDAFLSDWPNELASVRKEIRGWLEWAWRKKIGAFILHDTLVKKISEGQINFRNIPAQYKVSEEILLLCINSDLPGTVLPKKIKTALEQYLGISISTRDDMKKVIADIKANPKILHDALHI